MTITHLQDTVTLNNGVKMPQLGLGVWKAKDGEETYAAVKHAIQHGYRAIDTAAAYKNEESVGKAIKDSGVPREELFITTKVWNADHGYDATIRAFETSLEKLGLEYLDLYLIHWPVKDKYKDTWKALERLYSDGKVRAIGVCNFNIHHLEDLLAEAKTVPAVNQSEFHPYLTQEPLREFCKSKGIHFEGWSPLGNGKLLDNASIQEIAKKYNKTAAQVILRWHLQNDAITIPKSVTPSRIEENAAIFDFELTAEDMNTINSLNKDERTGPDPDNFNF